jgi:hypothetical protein
MNYWDIGEIPGGDDMLIEIEEPHKKRTPMERHDE